MSPCFTELRRAQTGSWDEREETELMHECIIQIATGRTAHLFVFFFVHSITYLHVYTPSRCGLHTMQFCQMPLF